MRHGLVRQRSYSIHTKGVCHIESMYRDRDEGRVAKVVRSSSNFPNIGMGARKLVFECLSGRSSR
jgi:hypothetical protein